MNSLSTLCGPATTFDMLLITPCSAHSSALLASHTFPRGAVSVAVVKLLEKLEERHDRFQKWIAPNLQTPQLPQVLLEAES